MKEPKFKLNEVVKIISPGAHTGKLAKIVRVSNGIGNMLGHEEYYGIQIPGEKHLPYGYSGHELERVC